MSWLKNSGCISCKPGWNSSARIARAMAPPVNSMVMPKIRYIRPMSLWLVVVIQRIAPLGVWWS